MAPHATDPEVCPAQLDDAPVAGQNVKSTKMMRTPLEYGGSLDSHRSFERTPVIGTEFPDLQITDILHDDTKIRDLAILASQRGVIFLRNQDITPDQLKTLGNKIGELSERPSTSGLHKHAFAETQRELSMKIYGKFDPEVWVISSDIQRDHFPDRFTQLRPLASDEWHVDLAYEKVPSAYSILHMRSNPEDGSGGDTLWASTYEVYDRLSPPMKELVDGMTAWQNHTRMTKVIKSHGLEVNLERGAPENATTDFTATHPVVRTNPVTGWKHLYGGIGVSVRDGHIDDVTKHESDLLKDYFNKLIAQNHDLQVRFKWGKGDLAIWDNRGTAHSATDDFEGKREGIRVMSLGEVPYYDPASISRRQALWGHK